MKKKPNNEDKLNMYSATLQYAKNYLHLAEKLLNSALYRGELPEAYEARAKNISTDLHKLLLKLYVLSDEVGQELRKLAKARIRKRPRPVKPVDNEEVGTGAGTDEGEDVAAGEGTTSGTDNGDTTSDTD